MTKGHPTNSCTKTSTCWRRSEPTLICGRWLIKGLLPSFTTIECALGSSRRAT
ncbi:hypothetical protein BHM03_00033110 [Ensete ventricosum]|nr:hypothetical protein BHM03_00033110 [Ensete ventricosum]